MNKENARKKIEAFDFASLFADELLWNRLRAGAIVEADGRAIELKGIAEKSGVQVFHCPPLDDGRLPPYALRQKIERALTRQAREHLVIYTDAANTAQVWQWVAREPGKPAAYRELVWHKSQASELLLEKLGLIAFRLEDDDTLLTVIEVAGRLRDAFDREKLTKRFYDNFKLARDAFAGFIKGLPDDASQSWYVSVMINRLMFVYFLQRKQLPDGEGFLDNRHDYLRHHLNETRQQGKDRYYREFLCPLFFQGFAQGERRDEVRARFGDIPYLNGGLFNRHPLEEVHGAKIVIPDQAFEKLFDFFDQWDWHLDERPIESKSGKDINPDVLGYIFEKFINQKQMGAYYTKEDITGYICRNTVLPFLLARIRERCPQEFEAAAWPLLAQDPDRYIWPAMQKGKALPLPPEIADGLDTEHPNLIERRKPWNKTAPEDYALPTEIWREVVARRQRFEEVRNKLAHGEVREVNDLVTYNLDIGQFAEDLIAGSEDPAIVRALWRALVGVIPAPGASHREFEYGVAVLDPTCGSGAFLFAALNILEPLYRACLNRMRAFVLQADLEGERQKFPDFRKVLADAASRPNEKYFVYKSIVVNNLYGVDIMDEAVEIAKLRLFLKLVAQLDDKRHIEPLPDIDFNIRAGNTLVGFASHDEVKKAVTHDAAGQARMLFDDATELIERDALEAERAYLRFKQQQVALGGAVTPEDKVALRDKLKDLDDRLNWYLAREYGVDPTRSDDVEQWRASQKPFHWFVDFYGIMKKGGFDVIVGNPPYVEDKKVEDYSVLGYSTEDCGNLYAYTTERSLDLLFEHGRMGVILPLASIGVEGTSTFRATIARHASPIWHASFGFRPAKLFEGVNLRLTILLLAKSDRHHKSSLLSSRYVLWSQEERRTLFQRLVFQPSMTAPDGRFLKAEDVIAFSVFRKVIEKREKVGTHITKAHGFKLSYHRSPLYWIRAMDFDPYFKSDTKERSVHHFRDLHFAEGKWGKFVGALLNSTLFYFWFVAVGNCRNLTNEDIVEVPIGSVSPAMLTHAAKLFSELMVDYDKNSEVTKRYNCEYQTFYPSLSKPILDEVDRLLGDHYGFTEEERDFIVNYDIKYRMGAEAADD